MSATIHWRPASDNGRCFDGGTSTSHDRLRSVLGSILERKDIPKLRAMAVAADDKFYDEVADIIEKVGDIRIWVTD